MSYSFADVIYPITPEDFFENYWNKKSLFVKGHKDKFKNLFSWQEINRICKEHRLSAPDIRLAHEGKSTDDLLFLKTRVTPRGTTLYSIDIPVLYSLLSQGASLVLDAVDEMSPAVSEFCESIGREFSCQFSVNAYSVWGSDPGFGVHWDDHDLFVVQIDGKKHWRLYGTTRPYPLDKDTEPTPFPDIDKFEWEEVIEPGDIIYIPRGHWHGATGMNEPTLHLTCGMNNPTGVELLNWVVDELRSEIATRQDLPRFSSKEEKEKYIQTVREIVQKKLSGNILDEYESFWKANNQSRTNLSLPFGGMEPIVPDDDDFNLCFSGISHSPIADTGNNTFVFSAIGKEVELALIAKPICELILTGKPLSVSTLIEIGKENGLSRDLVRKIVDVLVVQGLVHIYR